MSELRSSNEIIKILKSKMKNLNLNQKELAEKTGVSTSAISRYFNGSREFPINEAPIFAKVLNIDLNYLLGISTDKPKTIEDIDFTGIDRIAAEHKGEKFTEDELAFIQNAINLVKAQRGKK